MIITQRYSAATRGATGRGRPGSFRNSLQHEVRRLRAMMRDVSESPLVTEARVGELALVLTVEDEQFVAGGLVVDDLTVGSPLELSLPEEHIALEFVDVLSTVRCLVLGYKQPDGTMPRRCEDASIDCRIINAKPRSQVARESRSVQSASGRMFALPLVQSMLCFEILEGAQN